MESLNIQIEIRLNKLMYDQGLISQTVYKKVNDNLHEKLTKYHTKDIVNSSKMKRDVINGIT
jgi:hypothetical protein